MYFRSFYIGLLLYIKLELVVSVFLDLMINFDAFEEYCISHVDEFGCKKKIVIQCLEAAIERIVSRLVL